MEISCKKLGGVPTVSNANGPYTGTLTLTIYGRNDSSIDLHLSVEDGQFVEHIGFDLHPAPTFWKRVRNAVSALRCL